MNQIKVPKEVMEVFYESVACKALAAHYARGFFPSLKAIYYKQKAVKADILAWRAMAAAHPAVKDGDWVIDTHTGLATKEVPPVADVPKKVRAPRKAKVAPAAAEGEKV